MQIHAGRRDNIVELHWRGRELVRTAGVDRRLAVLDLVKELRELKAPKEGLSREMSIPHRGPYSFSPLALA